MGVRIVHRSINVWQGGEIASQTSGTDSRRVTARSAALATELDRLAVGLRRVAIAEEKRIDA
jgi:hypothetical protein